MKRHLLIVNDRLEWVKKFSLPFEEFDTGNSRYLYVIENSNSIKYYKYDTSNIFLLSIHLLKSS